MANIDNSIPTVCIYAEDCKYHRNNLCKYNHTINFCKKCIFGKCLYLCETFSKDKNCWINKKTGQMYKTSKEEHDKKNESIIRKINQNPIGNTIRKNNGKDDTFKKGIEKIRELIHDDTNKEVISNFLYEIYAELIETRQIVEALSKSIHQTSKPTLPH